MVIENRLNFIYFRGQVKFDKLSSYYDKADCFILPTLGDYRALVGFETMYYGCAIIDSIYDGARFEVVEEGKNGYIIDPKNIEEFKNAILNIVVDKGKRDSFKKYSLNKIQNYTHTKCNDNLITTIKEVINDI